jgi:hypothetical protein
LFGEGLERELLSFGQLPIQVVDGIGVRSECGSSLPQFVCQLPYLCLKGSDFCLQVIFGGVSLCDCLVPRLDQGFEFFDALVRRGQVLSELCFVCLEEVLLLSRLLEAALALLQVAFQSLDLGLVS